jgi:septum site-determining protein MinC
VTRRTIRTQPWLKLVTFQRLLSMSAVSPGNATAAFDLKSASLTLVAFVLKTGNLASLAQAMDERYGATPDFFSRDPVVIDLTHLASLDAKVDFEALVKLLTRFNLNPVAVRGGTTRQTEAALAAGLGEAPDAHPARTETVVKEVVREIVREVPVEVQVEVPVGVPTLIIDKPLRSGQQVYAKGGDLVVLAAVNNGAEVIADGSIHVYAPLRGKAIAGAKGNTEARIFSTSLEPELLSIAGTYRTTENPLPANVVGQPAQVRLEGDRLVFEPISL